MTPKSAAQRFLPLVAAFGVAGLSACASTPTPPPAVVARPPVTKTAPAVVTMAPIANPEEEEERTRREPSRREEQRKEERREERREEQRKEEPPAAPRATPVRPPASGERIDPAAAAHLRARGLEELNRGAVAKAVALLSQASRLDPGNAVIRRDLERAERINRAVHGPH